MGADGETALLRLRVPNGINANDLNREIDRVWEEFRQTPDLQAKTPLPKESIERQTPPLLAKRGEAQFGVAEAILISVLGGLGKDAALRLWDQVIWPQLKRSPFGADLSRVSDDAG